MKRIVSVGFSGGVTSAWCAGWALKNYPSEEVRLLWHDTKEEDEDTYRFLREAAAALGKEITERSDGRSVTDLFYDNGALANNRMAFCSRILKVEQRQKYFKELRNQGYDDLVLVLGFSAREEQRIQRATASSWQGKYTVLFPTVSENVTKQQCYDWCRNELKVEPPRMYAWSEHANCPGCVRGGKAYWLKVAKNRPDVFKQRAGLEEEFGHTFLKDTTLIQLQETGLKRAVGAREAIDIGSCECGS